MHGEAAAALTPQETWWFPQPCLDSWYSRVHKQQPFKDIDTNTNEAFLNEWKHLSNYIHQIYIKFT